jgi:hypothetical protein
MKKLIILATAVVVISVMAIPATLFADSHRVDSFVCPVLKPVVGDSNNPNIFPIADGDYSILPGKAAGDPGTHLNSPVAVPEGATNGDGDGSPGGWHAKPGDTDYTAIWSLE